MRIIGGTLRKKRLHTLRIPGVRPTADRLRESIFNILGPRVATSTVLDLFAGTGAMGIEALSRGAKKAVFVEINAKVAALIQRNLESCRLDHQARVLTWDIARNLDCLGSLGLEYDLVFIDPPYHQQLILPALQHLVASGCLGPQAQCVIEHGPGELPPENLSGFELTGQRPYGKTLISFLSYRERN